MSATPVWDTIVATAAEAHRLGPEGLTVQIHPRWWDVLVEERPDLAAQLKDRRARTKRTLGRAAAAGVMSIDVVAGRIEFCLSIDEIEDVDCGPGDLALLAEGEGRCGEPVWIKRLLPDPTPNPQWGLDGDATDLWRQLVLAGSLSPSEAADAARAATAPPAAG